MRNLVIVRKTIILFSVINIVVIVYSVIMRIQNVNQRSELGLFFWFKIIFCLLLCGYMIFEAVIQKKLYETVGLCGYCKFIWVLWIFGLVIFLV